MKNLMGKKYHFFITSGLIEQKFLRKQDKEKCKFYIISVPVDQDGEVGWECLILLLSQFLQTQKIEGRNFTFQASFGVSRIRKVMMDCKKNKSDNFTILVFCSHCSGEREAKILYFPRCQFNNSGSCRPEKSKYRNLKKKIKWKFYYFGSRKLGKEKAKIL